VAARGACWALLLLTLRVVPLLQLVLLLQTWDCGPDRVAGSLTPFAIYIPSSPPQQKQVEQEEEFM